MIAFGLDKEFLFKFILGRCEEELVSEMPENVLTLYMDGTLCSSSFTNNASVACKDINLDSASDVLALAMCSSLKNAKKKFFFR